MQLIIKSPVGFDPAVYNWPPENQDNNGASEIIETIKCVYEDLPELNTLFRKESLFDYDSKSYDSMRLLCELYNKAIDRILDSNPAVRYRTPKKPSINLVQHIIHQAYNQSVIDPDKLNQYKPFSPEVYGETSFEFVRQMIEEIGIKDEDVFVDLGSGVGQVVLQVAALTNAKLCVGIEKAEVPAVYSTGMSDAFKFWMQWYGKQCCEYQLMKGDFFSEKYRDTINNGTFIFVNNFAFGPAVDNDLKLRFQELKDGARIVSSKAFCPLNFRITDRTLSDIGSIMRVEEIQPKYKKSVSWTGKPVSYYLHEIDRRKLEEFFSNSKIPKNKTNDTEMAKSRRNSSKSINNNSHHSTADQSSNDSSKFSSKDDSPVYGPTTRKAWSEYIKTAKNDPQALIKDHLQNGIHDELNHKKESSTSDQTDIGKLMTSDSEDTSDTLIESKTERQRTSSCSSSKTRKLMSERRTNKPSNEQISSPNHNNFTSSSLDKRPPGRPRKSKNNDKTKKQIDSSLDLLHEKTVLSISSTVANEIPIGCFDSKLSAFDETLRFDNLRDENIENKQQNTAPKDQVLQTVTEQAPPPPKYPHLQYNLTLDLLVNNFRNQMVSFLGYSKSDEYKQDILNKIEEEQKLNAELTNRINMMETQINEQLARGVQALKSKLAQVDIYPNDPDEMMLRASEMIERNKELHSKVKSMDSCVTQLEVLHKKLNQIHLTNQKVNNSFENLNNLNQMNNLNNLASLNSLKNMNNNLTTNSSKANSKATKKSTSKQAKDASKISNPHQQTNSHSNSQLNQRVNYATENNNLSKANQLSTFQQNQQQQTINNNPPYYNNQSLSNLNNISSLTNFNNLNAVLNNGNLANNLNNNGLNTTNSLTNIQQMSYENNNLASNQSVKSTPTSNHSQNNSLSSTPSHSNTNLSAHSMPTTHDKHWDRIKEKVNKSKCNNNFIKNDPLSNSNSLPTPMITVSQASKLSRKDSLSITAKALNGTTHQFPELEEDVIKKMIEAAFNNNEGVNIGNSANNMYNQKTPTKPRKPRQPRASKNAANKNQNNSDLTNHSNVSFEQANKQSNKSLSSSQSALASEQPKIYSTAASGFSSLFQNLHNSHTTTTNSFLSTKKSLSNASSNLASNEDNNNRSEPNAIKLTLKKIDRERDSYTLVKSPPKSPEKIATPTIDHPKRKHNISPDHKPKKSKSPKYTSSINSSGAYEPEKRLILKLTNMSH